MIDLILVGASTAFVLAVFDSFIDLVAMFINAQLVNATIAIIASSGAVWLDGHNSVKMFILHAIAGAFIGRAFLTVAERFSAYRPTVINTNNR